MSNRPRKYKKAPKHKIPWGRHEDAKNWVLQYLKDLPLPPRAPTRPTVEERTAEIDAKARYYAECIPLVLRYLADRGWRPKRLTLDLRDPGQLDRKQLKEQHTTLHEWIDDLQMHLVSIEMEERGYLESQSLSERARAREIMRAAKWGPDGVIWPDRIAHERVQRWLFPTLESGDGQAPDD